MISWKDSRPTGQIYKYVDLGHAESVAKGALRIGTFQSYVDLEERHDAEEGIIRYDPGSVTFGDVHENQLEREAFASFGLHIETAHIDWRVPMIKRIPPVYCLCFSSDSDNALLQSAKPQAIFMIDKIADFLDAITSEYRLGVGYAADVEYKSRRVTTPAEALRVPDPFTKNPSRADGYPFHKEKEFRFIWPSGNQNIAPFIGTPNARVAAFLTRIN